MIAFKRKPILYSETEFLSIKMEKEKEHVRELLDEAQRITRFIHQDETIRNCAVKVV